MIILKKFLIKKKSKEKNLKKVFRKQIAKNLLKKFHWPQKQTNYNIKHLKLNHLNIK
jgi:hypothetical protein